MPIPTLGGLPSMKFDQLSSSLVAIDDAIVALCQDEAGETRSLSTSEEQRLDHLLLLQSRTKAHLSIRKQFDAHPNAVEPSMANRDSNGHSGPQVMFRGDPWADTSQPAYGAPQ